MNEKKKKITKQITLQVAGIVFFSICLACVVNAVRPDGIALVYEPEEQAGGNREKTGQSKPFPKEIAISAAIDIFKKEKAVFVDSRPEHAYHKAHIKGAVHLPVQEFDENFGVFFSTVSPDIQIITYCDGEHCDLGKHLAEKLYEMGYEKVYYLHNGLTRWKQHNLPVDSENT